MKKKIIQSIILIAFAFLLSYVSYSQTNEKGPCVKVMDGYAVMMGETVDTKSLDRALFRFRDLYTRYMEDSDSRIYYSIIPDKAYFFPDDSKQTFDYSFAIERMADGMEYAEYIDILPLLTLDDYYRLDVHWKQEKIVDVAELLAQKMGVEVCGEYIERQMDKPFYGSYCKDKNLLVEPDVLRYLDNDILQNCKVYDFETQSYGSVYCSEIDETKDAYCIFLSGPKSLLTIENPCATTNRELIIFRDSFASSLAPLLAGGYAKITLVDIRYISSAQLKNFIDFRNKDILFLYSTPVLNNSITFR